MNANYEAGAGPGAQGKFAFLIVTEDGHRHELEPDTRDVAAVIALLATDGPTLFDPVNQTLIATNLVGRWLPQDWSGLPTESP